MRCSSAIIASAALVAGANATYDNVTYTTEIVTAYTTYCPSPTAITHGNKIYTVTEATTLTITNCPCTLTKPVYTAPVVYCSTCPYTTPAVPVNTPVASVSTPEVPYTTPVESVPSVPTTYPVETVTPGTTYPVGTAPAGSPSVPSVPEVPTTGVPVPSVPVTHPYANSTVPAPVGSGSPAPSAGAPGTTTGPLPYKGAANKAYAASGLSLAGLVGLAAFLL
ncbi:hypothetical protein MMC29_008278 [Sticta canariensis]|nr:hypothetical protein [Sticta canariensis]